MTRWGIIDQLKRPIRDLRISVTDKCNFRCTYCMPKEIFGDDYPFLPQEEQLSFPEIIRLVRLFSSLGVNKIRLTGGEPLLRKDLAQLIKQIIAIDGIEDVGLTTNGVLLKTYGQELWEAGLRRLNISLDALNSKVFGDINGRGFKPTPILTHIDFVIQLGFEVKVNMVVQKDVNEQEIISMATYFKDRGITLRFIEFMDVGNDNKWNIEKVVTKNEIIKILNNEFKLEPTERAYYGEVAQLYNYKDSNAKVGFITSISESFCQTCTRARLSSDGKLFTCLFATDGYDLRQLLRSGHSDLMLVDRITKIWHTRADRYSDERNMLKNLIRNKIDMSYIGG